MSLTGIDHVILPVRDIDAAVDHFQRRLGFYIPPEERGSHSQLGTVNACIDFRLGYV
jgi:hypothetical protein